MDAAKSILQKLDEIRQRTLFTTASTYGKSKQAMQYWFERARRATTAMLGSLPEHVNLELKHIGGLEAMNGLEWLVGYGGHEAFHYKQIDETIKLNNQGGSL